jgi:hypothetical protein
MIPASPRPGQRVLVSLLSLLLVVAGCGGLPFFRTEAPPTVVVSPGPSGPLQSFPAGDGEGDLFIPPDPLCPAPPGPVAVPVVTASAGTGSVLLAVGSSSVTTCATSGSGPVASGSPVVPLRVAAGDIIRLTLSPGWSFLYWQGWNIPGASSASATPEGDTPDHPASIIVPVPGKTGSWVVGVSVWAIREDGRAVSGIEGTVLVQH